MTTPATPRADKTTGADLYARLRRTGEIHLAAHDTGGLGTARRLATADGFQVHQYRPRDTPGMSRHQRRTRPLIVSLTRPGSDLIVAPDAHRR